MSAQIKNESTKPGAKQMPEDDRASIIAALRRLEHLSSLDDQQLEGLAELLDVQKAPPGTCLLPMGSEDKRLLFLLSGRVELVANDGARHVVADGDEAAQGPLSKLRPSRYRVTAQTLTRYLFVEQQLLDRYVCDLSTQAFIVEETDLFNTASQLIEGEESHHPLIFDLFDDINRGHVFVPSDPEVAVHVGRSLNPNGDIPKMAKTLSRCPVITLKVLRAAKLIGGAEQVSRNIPAAIKQLGAEQCFEFAVRCVLRESLRSDSQTVRNQMRAWWRRAVQMGAVCRVLARIDSRFDRDSAGVVGLMHSISEPVLLSYADQHADLQDPAALQRVLRQNRATVSQVLLTLWNMPHEAVETASINRPWSYDHDGDPNYSDITIAALWHIGRSDDGDEALPAADDVPSLVKSGLANPPDEIMRKVAATIERINNFAASLADP
ncbi:HDOD domain-containing protein [Thiosocius teredinicola]|uniref:HDOD domain-containing protein n=1 Tax=Thiosocius teredinicola TaxID=1973002 RepID=UPI000990BC7C